MNNTTLIAAQQKDAVFQASLDFIGTLTGLKPPPIEVAPPEVFAPFREFAERVCAIFEPAATAAPTGELSDFDKRAAAEDPQYLARNAACSALNKYVDEWFTDYEFHDGESFYHTPTEFERLLIADAFAGLGADDDYLRLESAWRALCNATPPQSGWTPATEPPKESDGEVLVLMRNGRREIAWATYWHGASTGFAGWTFRDPDEEETPTHWMPLPAAPATSTLEKS